MHSREYYDEGTGCDKPLLLLVGRDQFAVPPRVEESRVNR